MNLHWIVFLGSVAGSRHEGVVVKMDLINLPQNLGIESKLQLCHGLRRRGWGRAQRG